MKGGRMKGGEIVRYTGGAAAEEHDVAQAAVRHEHGRAQPVPHRIAPRRGAPFQRALHAVPRQLPGLPSGG